MAMRSRTRFGGPVALALVAVTLVGSCGGSKQAAPAPACRPSPSVGVSCGATVCVAPSPVCCPSKDGFTGPNVVPYCASDTGACYHPGGSYFEGLECDETTDCPNGTVCCSSGPTAQCRTHCEGLEVQGCRQGCECIDGSTHCVVTGRFPNICCFQTGTNCSSNGGSGAGEECCSGVCALDSNSRGAAFTCR